MGWRELGLAVVMTATAGCFAEPETFGSGDDSAGDTDGVQPTTKGDSGPDTGDGSTSGDPGSTTTPGSTTSDDTDGGSSGGEPFCGDGVVEGDELCEPDLDDGCTEQCVPMGNRIWLTLLDDVIDDEGSWGQDMLVSSDGTIVVAAQQLAYAAGVQAVVRRFDGDGSVLGTEPLPGDEHDGLGLVELDSQYHVLAHDGFLPWLARLDSEGGLAWRTDWDGGGTFQAYDLTADGDLLYVFMTDMVDGVGLRPTLRGIDPSGAEQWSTTFEGHYGHPLLAPAGAGAYVQYGLGDPDIDTEREVCHVNQAGTSLGCWTFDLDAEIVDMHVTTDTVYVAGYEVRQGQSTWVLAAFDLDGNEQWRTTAFDDADTDRNHQPNAMATTADGRLVVAGSVRGRGGDIIGAWATFDAQDGAAEATWMDDEVGPVKHVAVLDGTLVSSGSMPLSMFPKPVFLMRQHI